MRLVFQICIVIFWSLCGSAEIILAADEKGNGGHVIECRQHGKKIDTVYDLWGHLNLFDHSNASYIERIDKAILRIKDMYPNLYNELRWIEYMLLNGMRIEKNSLRNVRIVDLSFEKLPSNCIYKLAAYQPFSTYRSYPLILDSVIWIKLDELNRAALILHEILYRRFYSVVSPYYIRKLTSLLLMTNWTIEDKIDFDNLVESMLEVQPLYDLK